MPSRSAASRVAEQLWVNYQAFATRSLAEIPMVYLFVDGVAERLHLGQPREAILAAWGMAEDGTKHLLGLFPGTKEDTASGRRADARQGDPPHGKSFGGTTFGVPPYEISG